MPCYQGSQLVEQRPDLLAHPCRHGPHELRILRPPPDPLHLEAGKHDALLRAVVQVASDAAALCVGGHDDPASRRPDLAGRLVEPLNSRTEVDDEATVVDRQLQRGGDRRDDAGVGDEGLVVAQRADRLGAPHRPPPTGVRDVVRGAVAVDEPAVLRTRRPEHPRAAVAQGPDHEVVEQSGLDRGLGDAAGDLLHLAGATEGTHGEGDEEGDRYRGDHRDLDDEDHVEDGLARVGMRDRDAAGDHGDGEDAVPEEGEQLPSHHR